MLRHGAALTRLRGFRRPQNLLALCASLGERRFQTASVRHAPMIKVTVDGKEAEVVNGSTVLQACEVAGVTIPRFCFHERLSVAGNCRMCLVEVEKSPKPVASCAMPAMPGMKIKTTTPLVRKAREGVMEFLLANHPLDCPICDQGGECDLQDQSIAYGTGLSRFDEPKRTVEDKDLGPFVKTVMTRCIHCTRCVRFADEVAGVEVLGATGRGQTMEIGTYTAQKFDSEVSGNVIDLCPVGALTSKPYAFRARPWELRYTESIDVLDAVGANIRIDTRGLQVMRVIPRLNEDVNEEWMADKGRFAYDGLTRQRLDFPLIRPSGSDQFVRVDWAYALESVKKGLAGVRGNQMMAIAGDLVEAESVIALKDLMNRLGCSNLQADQAPFLSADLRSDYLLNSTLVGVEDADVLLLVGSNPRMEAPLFNVRIRKSVMNHGLHVASVGPKLNATFPYEHLGDHVATLKAIAAGSHPICKQLEKAQHPMIVLGMGPLSAEGGEGVLALTKQIAAKYPAFAKKDWNGFNILHSAASRGAIQDLGFTPGVNPPAKPQFVYLLGSDRPETLEKIPKDAFVVYQGHHGDAGASRADVILPAAAYTEQMGTYVNTEGRVQLTRMAIDPVGQARPGWKVIRALSETLGKTLPYDSIDQVRARLADVAPHFAKPDHLEFTEFTTSAAPSKDVADVAFAPYLKNYFMTDVISRNSSNMAKATKQLPNASNSYL